VQRKLRRDIEHGAGKMVDTDGMVYELPDGSVCYFQDRNRKYPFTAGPEALPLLRGLLKANKRVFSINRKLLDATNDIQETIQQGKVLYADKPTMKQHNGALGTWSNDEYAHPGFQCEYLHFKSFQRFTESWALFERAAQWHIFDRYLHDTTGGALEELSPIHVVSLGGGPGYELFAFELFFEYWAMTRHKSASEAASWLCHAREFVGRADGSELVHAADEKDEIHNDEACSQDELIKATKACSIANSSATHHGAKSTSSSKKIPPLKLASLDLQPTWEPYVLALPDHNSTAQYSFAQWNIKDSIDAVKCSGFPRIDLCIISNLLVYCSDEQTANVLFDLFTIHNVHAILVNERGTEQKIIKMMEDRGIVFVRLMDQTCGIHDDRQLLLLPPGTSLPSRDKSQNDHVIFPNVPFEEHKHAMAQQSSPNRMRKLRGFA
jgi:hypothetical protein